uniref:NADH-ubiquinone oxidoreductase chain 2 n=1 Tax=Solenosthedium bilunatum TaxID=2080405 RepID=A0A2K9YV35_9HEMI|nr:NADH dehydrogenase subunit 2 [Solenosthedium bilunatum]
MKKSKSLFTMIMVAGTILTISSNNWMSMWMGLEMNMMAFIPLMSMKNKSSSEAMMIYLLVQSVSSMILMFSIIMSNLLMNNMFTNMTLISLLIKLGAAPFHLWIPEILVKMDWMNSLILMTWQKIAPMMMINNLMYNNKIMHASIIMSVIVGAIGGLNQMSMRKIMGYSSINHSGWMLALAKTKNSWIAYLTIYSMMMLLLCWMFYSNNVIHINQMNNMKMTSMEKLTYTISMLSLGGLPPFLGFLPKWIVIQNMTYSGLYLMLTIMIMCSLLQLFYYMRTMTSMMLSFPMMNKWISVQSSKMMMMLILLTNMSLPLVLIMNFM